MVLPFLVLALMALVGALGGGAVEAAEVVAARRSDLLAVSHVVSYPLLSACRLQG